MENKSQEIKNLKHRISSTNLKTSWKYLQTELDEVKGLNENEELKKKIENLEKKDKKRWDLLKKNGRNSQTKKNSIRIFWKSNQK